MRARVGVGVALTCPVSRLVCNTVSYPRDACRPVRLNNRSLLKKVILAPWRSPRPPCAPSVDEPRQSPPRVSTRVRLSSSSPHRVASPGVASRLKLLGFGRAEIIALAHQRLLHPFTRRFRICEFLSRRSISIVAADAVSSISVACISASSSCSLSSRCILLHAEIFSHQSQLFLSTV